MELSDGGGHQIDARILGVLAPLPGLVLEVALEQGLDVRALLALGDSFGAVLDESGLERGHCGPWMGGC